MHAAQIIPENCSFFDFPEDWYQMDYHDRKELGKGILWFHEEYDLDPLYKQEDIEFLKTLSDNSILETPLGNVFLSHYVYPNLSGLRSTFFTYADEFNQQFNYAQSKNCRISICGHSHIKGFFLTTKKRYRTYRSIPLELPESDICIGIPPITSNGKKSGFCILDTDENMIQSIRV